MSGILKYAFILFLIYGFCYGITIQKCFTLEDISSYTHVYYAWKVQVSLQCPKGFIRIGEMIYSIPKYYVDFCIIEQCIGDLQTEMRCDCCKKQ